MAIIIRIIGVLAVIVLTWGALGVAIDDTVIYVCCAVAGIGIGWR
jgi:hypothetical protein